MTGGMPDGRSALALREGTEDPENNEFWGPNALAQHGYHA